MQEIENLKNRKLYGKSKKNDSENSICFFFSYLAIKFPELSQHSHHEQKLEKYYQRFQKIIQQENKRKNMDLKIIITVYLVNTLSPVNCVFDREMNKIYKILFLERNLEGNSLLGQFLTKNFKFENLLDILIN